MSDSCCNNVCKVELNETNKGFKKILWIALVLNFSMFMVDIVFAVLARSLSLKADAIDFLGDSANYFITLFVVNSVLSTKAHVSLLKAAFMFCFGMWILVEALISFNSTELPKYLTMSWVGGLAMAVNTFVAVLLYKFRNGDSNMQSVWMCSRNDAIGNLAVLVASAGVYFLSSKWPDLIVAIFIATLAVTSSYKVMKLALAELNAKAS
ncbi:MAG: cation transporter [Bacteriovorax sp.]|jgi:Co/Zn/Cd efflux system component